MHRKSLALTLIARLEGMEEGIFFVDDLLGFIIFDYFRRFERAFRDTIKILAKAFAQLRAV